MICALRRFTTGASRAGSGRKRRLVTFTEVGRTVATAQSDWAVEIVVASGAIVRVRAGADPGLLRTVLEALA